MKKLLIYLLLSTVCGLPSISTAFAEETCQPGDPGHYEFSVFTRETCGHCQDLEEFLETDFKEAVTNITPKYYDLDDSANYDLFKEFCNNNGLTRSTPTILIGNQIIQGFGGADSTGQQLIDLALTMTDNSFFEDYNTQEVSSSSEMIIEAPFIGEIDLTEYSLPILSVILGFVDGFNPCAMWVLIMFLTILLQAGNRKKMFQMAGIFIIAETLMYYLILNVWYKTWDFVQLDNVVTPIIGAVSVGAGIYFIYEFFTNKDGECKITSYEQKQKISTKIKNLVTLPLTIGVFFGTLALAFSVNIIEFACSIGIPQAFTKVLDLNNLGFVLRQIYIMTYTLFYMMDDFLVFGIALFSFQFLGLTTKYTRYCLIIGGTIMLVLGYFFIFAPEKLIL
ncbi:MAG: glutaredoxin [Candidatus Peregrinibacteria bacterium GW2011_GWF2_43_17]|nr:MAG: glutaredoxin [Candidatus Peregrinibacteria bacterium GW2011_GWF2_43_17]HAU39552.1 glutaredoxin [Candidatus Peregrinibacteria bacterium]